MISVNNNLVMQLDSYPPVLKAIPAARLVAVNGKQVFVCPHVPDAVKILQNLGLTVPPLKLDFKPTGRLVPRQNQLETVSFLVENRRAFVLSEMRTGKTAGSLWALEYLFQTGQAKRALIIAPISVFSTWEQAFFDVIPHRGTTRLYGPKEKRLEILAKDSQICLINHDGVEVIASEIETAKFDVIIIDEGHVYRNRSTNRYKIIRELTKTTPTLWLMTGTPTPNDPADAWALIKLITPMRNLGGYIQFKELVMRKVSTFTWIARQGSKEIVYKYMQPAIRHTRAECFDLPELMYINRDYELTDEQNKAFKRMRDSMVIDHHEGEKITAANAAVRLFKLIQICGGVVRNNDSEPLRLDAAKKLSVLRDIIEESTGKCVVFIPFKAVMESVCEYLKKKGVKVAMANGDTSVGKRLELFRVFQQTDNLDVLLLHPEVGGVGVDFSCSSTTIWYSPTFKVLDYTQGNARMMGPKQQNKMAVIHLIATPLEAAIYRALAGKVKLQDAILQQYQEVIN
jgi:SNF2 family DNA or RNA helicase